MAELPEWKEFVGDRFDTASRSLEADASGFDSAAGNGPGNIATETDVRTGQPIAFVGIEPETNFPTIEYRVTVSIGITRIGPVTVEKAAAQQMVIEFGGHAVGT